MKKLLALIMALMMMLSLAACSNVVKTNDKDDDDKATTEQKDDNSTSQKEEEEDKEDKKPSKKDEDLEDVIEGEWVTELDFADYLNEMVAEELGSEDDMPEDFKDLFEFEEFVIALNWEFDNGDISLSAEVLTDAEDLADQIRDPLVDWMKDYIKEAGEDVEDDVIEDTVDEMISEMVDSLSSEFDNLEDLDETAEYEVDGDAIIIDGDEFGTVDIKNEDKLVINANEGLELPIGDTIDKLTLERK